MSAGWADMRWQITRKPVCYNQLTQQAPVDYIDVIGFIKFSTSGAITLVNVFLPILYLFHGEDFWN